MSGDAQPTGDRRTSRRPEAAQQRAGNRIRDRLTALRSPGPEERIARPGLTSKNTVLSRQRCAGGSMARVSAVRDACRRRTKPLADNV
jgi:hypothetical protein